MHTNEKIKIKLLKIEKFRGIRELTLNFGEVNFLIGNNGTGKTTILAAIARLMPILRGENRIFLDADFYFQDNSRAHDIKLTYVIELINGGASTRLKLVIEVVGIRKNDGLSHGHLNDQLLAETTISIKDEEGNDRSGLISELNQQNFLKQRIIRNGWGGGRISPILLQTDQTQQRHAATSIQEEQGFHDALRARFIELLKNSELSQTVERNHPNLSENTLNFTNDFLGERRFKSIALAHGQLLSLERVDGSFEPWEGLSGGELSAFNLAMAIEFERSKPSQLLIFEEPEATIHPTIQIDFLKRIKTILPGRQIFISTHSPYLFMHAITDNKLFITRKHNEDISIEETQDTGFGLFLHSPSWGEINYFAYDIPTIEFHNELYDSLQERENKLTEKKIENWFISKGFSKEKIWFDNGPRKEETLMTFVRNRIHHGSNINRPKYTPEELKLSIRRMINLLRNP